MRRSQYRLPCQQLSNEVEACYCATVDEAGIGGQTAIFHAVALFDDYGLPVAQLLLDRDAGDDLARPLVVARKLRANGDGGRSSNRKTDNSERTAVGNPT